MARSKKSLSYGGEYQKAVEEAIAGEMIGETLEYAAGEVFASGAIAGYEEGYKQGMKHGIKKGMRRGAKKGEEDAYNGMLAASYCCDC